MMLVIGVDYVIMNLANVLLCRSIFFYQVLFLENALTSNSECPGHSSISVYSLQISPFFRKVHSVIWFRNIMYSAVCLVNLKFLFRNMYTC